MLHRKDKELHHQRRPSPAPSHSQGDECRVGDMNKKRARRSPPFLWGMREESPRERTVSPPPRKSRREEQDGDRFKGPVPHS